MRGRLFILRLSRFLVGDWDLGSFWYSLDPNPPTGRGAKSTLMIAFGNRYFIGGTPKSFWDMGLGDTIGVIWKKS